MSPSSQSSTVQRVQITRKIIILWSNPFALVRGISCMTYPDRHGQCAKRKAAHFTSMFSSYRHISFWLFRLNIRPRLNLVSLITQSTAFVNHVCICPGLYYMGWVHDSIAPQVNLYFLYDYTMPCRS